MKNSFNFTLDPLWLICIIITILGAAFSIFCIILRSKRLKSGNVVCKKKKFWVYNILLLILPVLMTFFKFLNTDLEPYVYAASTILLSGVLTTGWLNNSITFYSDGFTYTNAFFMKKFYPYNAVCDVRVVKRMVMSRRQYRNRSIFSFFDERYAYFANIYVKQEHTPELKQISIEVESYNYPEFIRMIDTNCPYLHNAQTIPVGEKNFVKFYKNNQ